MGSKGEDACRLVPPRLLHCDKGTRMVCSNGFGRSDQSIFPDPNDWINLTQTLVSTVQSVSPNTKIGVSIAADSLSTNAALYTSFLTGVSKISGLSFIGFDIYTESGFQNTQNFLTQNGNGGKDVWIAECWSGDGSGIFSSTRAT